MTATWARAEIRRAYRNRKAAVFSLAMPVLFYVFFSSMGDGDMGGLAYAAYLMVGMATFGALGAVFGISGRISAERTSGWNRQLRLTGLSPGAYLLGKTLAGYAVAVPPILVIFTLGATGHGVRMPAERWALVLLSLALALLPIAAMGIWVGYTADAGNSSVIGGGVYALMSLLGGLWVPADAFPRWLADLTQALPIYWVAAAGRAVLAGGWLGWHGTAVLVTWTAVLALLAARAFRRDTARA